MRNRFAPKKPRQNEEMVLQITSMADIFTIILVFLLKSYSTGAVGVELNPAIVPPSSKAVKEMPITLKLEVSPTAVAMEGKPIAQLQAFEFNPADLDSGVSKSLAQAFASERSRQPISADSKPDSRLTVVADQHTPYDTLKTVLASATTQGYTDFKLVVLKQEE